MDYYEEEKQMTIMQTQQSKLLNILKLNYDKFEDNTELQQYEKLFTWKVLIYDSHTKGLINLLLKVGDMRSCNVSVFLTLESKRDVIHNVAAIYLIKPCKESLDHVVEDLNSKIYDCAFINFASPCPTQLLENFATECGRYNSQERIVQIYEHYLDYYCVTNDMFSLNLSNAYLELNRNYELELGIDSYLQNVAEGVYMAMRSNSFFPYIQYQKKDRICEKIGRKICELFSHIEKSEEEKYGMSELKRPLLILLDRNIDLHTMLHHPWKYIGLVHDIFGISEGKVLGLYDKGKKVECELNFLDDQFLQLYALAEYPEATGEISTEFNKWKEEYESMTGKGMEDDKNFTSKLNEALDQIPEMTERKIHLEAHTNLATILYDHVKKREFDRLNELEIQIMTSKTVSSKV